MYNCMYIYIYTHERERERSQDLSRLNMSCLFSVCLLSLSLSRSGVLCVIFKASI